MTGVDLAIWGARICLNKFPKRKGLKLRALSNFFKTNHISVGISIIFIIFILLFMHIYTLPTCIFLLINAYFAYLRFKVLLSGDVHINPGPVLDGRLKFAHWNVNSLLTRNKIKIALIEAQQMVDNFDIFACSETFFNSKTKNDDIVIHGFFHEPFRADAADSDNFPKGGVVLYYKDHLPIKQRKDLEILPETVVAEINLDRNKKLFFIVTYRSPSQDRESTRAYFKNLKNLLIKIKTYNPASIVLTGDMNARSPLLWSGETVENLAGQELSEILTLENLENIIEEPTHLPNEDTQTCLDLIITSSPQAIVDHGVLPSKDPKCKHQIVYSKINFHIPPPPKYNRVLWDYKNCDKTGLKNALNSIDWANLLLDMDVNQMVEKFNDTLLSLAKIFIPSKTVTISDKNAPWLNNHIKYAIKKQESIQKMDSKR